MTQLTLNTSASSSQKHYKLDSANVYVGVCARALASAGPTTFSPSSAKVRFVEIHSAEVRLGQIRPDIRILYPPAIPSVDAFLQLCEMFGVSHEAAAMRDRLRVTTSSPMIAPFARAINTGGPHAVQC